MTVAVPCFLTFIPAAALARYAASNNVAPLAMLRARTAVTVSPAPVTSMTSRLRAGMAYSLLIARS